MGFCSASASAIPPTPRPASSVVISMPVLLSHINAAARSVDNLSALAIGRPRICASERPWAMNASLLLARARSINEKTIHTTTIVIRVFVSTSACAVAPSPSSFRRLPVTSPMASRTMGRVNNLRTGMCNGEPGLLKSQLRAKPISQKTGADIRAAPMTMTHLNNSIPRKPASSGRRSRIFSIQSG